jgi:uncharacterized protein (TIGR02687 family)
VSDKLREALDRHFARHRVVFWYDPDGANREVAESYAANGIDLVEVNNDQFALKYRLLKLQPEKRALVYVPSHRPPDDQNWLLDIELSHFVFSSNQAAWVTDELGLDYEFEELIQNHLAFFQNRSERLEPFQSIIKNSALRPDETSLRLAMLSVLVSDTRSERQSGKDLNGVLLKLFKDAVASEPEQRGYVEEIEKHRLAESFWEQIRIDFDFKIDEPTIDKLLAHLFRHALSQELGVTRDSCTRQAYTFVDAWRNNGYYSDSFSVLAERFGKELNVRGTLKGLPLEALLNHDLFKEADRQIVIRLIEQATNDAITARQAHRQVIERRASYWVSQDPGGKIRIYYDCLAEYFRFQIAVNELGSLGSSPIEIWQLYTGKLHEIDGLYRRFLELAELIHDTSVLEPLITSIEARYVNGFLQSLSETWSDSMHALSDLPDGLVPPQLNFFQKVVAPYLWDDRVVFVIVSDALRYESGVELSSLLESENRVQVSIEAYRSAVPTYTQLGMAALLPHRVLSIDPQSQMVASDGKTIQGMSGREALLSDYVSTKFSGKRAAAFNVKEFSEMAITQQEEEIRGLACVYLYSNHIDAVGDNPKTEKTLPGAVRAEINSLRSVVKRILNLNRTHIVITADHGFLYQYGAVEESDMVKIPDDSGFIRKDRRFVLGTGLRDDTRFLTVPAVEAGIGNEFDVYLAKGLMRIRKQGGGTRFVHGGASIQELCIPVIRIRKTREDDLESVHFVMLSKNREITTNSVVLEFFQTQPTGTKVRPRRLKLRFESESGEEIISSQRELNLESEDKNDQNRKITLDFVFTPGSAKYSGKLIYLTCYEDRYGQMVRVEERTGFRFRTVLTPDF